MDGQNLLLCDTEYAAVRDTYSPKASRLQTWLKEYLGTVHSIVEEKDLEGDAALALSNFIGVAERVLADELDILLQEHAKFTAQFVEDITVQDDIEF